jgi:hypothetical protein
MVCRDEMGQFMGASTLTFKEPLNLPSLKAVACREGLGLAQDLGLTRVCVASDCLEVINIGPKTQPADRKLKRA